ncbi:hypothetical protein [Moritella sp. F3]|uniref:hypothetical protein n=1 Tax=Moritella sp. F3 TaxID=2718882 RepID=UPI0018E1346A|nr:hypothetical protein [Moritella sp. F3]GIC77683.1 hypothetical protein FMO001_24100 [Moritella sp. F1]GIC82096.1 hypothetical protein FMO003_23770 [Moritella sp. F3]
MFKDLLVVRDHERQIFGTNWCGPESFDSHKKTLVAKFPKEPGSDGQEVEIYCTAGPSRFYDMKALPCTGCMGEGKKGFNMGTGSGFEMAELLVSMAKSIQVGMLKSLEDNDKPDNTTTITCPDCFYSDALKEQSGHIFCVNCESGLADLEERESNQDLNLQNKN